MKKIQISMLEFTIIGAVLVAMPFVVLLIVKAYSPPNEFISKLLQLDFTKNVVFVIFVSTFLIFAYKITKGDARINEGEKQNLIDINVIKCDYCDAEENPFESTTKPVEECSVCHKDCCYDHISEYDKYFKICDECYDKGYHFVEFDIVDKDEKLVKIHEIF